ncbi:peptidoglycan bridge formation glycyltransferase FemA/FemB family protein [Marispirochaeta sp.]|uniref:lipid II:glycine glycyltransferase FemX n=1 Tax=Marispirochaeta sp. TaxID=2038653 RepID=UPI0029C647DB|nr:peptidoglycan bridge formation glycyltransferase FemA/FemB family protein [Marispirochaeta sp.]
MPGAMMEPVSLDELDAHDNLLQTGYWGRVKENFGWTPFAFSFNEHPLLVLVRRLPLRQGIAYVPHGPMNEVEPHFFALFARNMALSLPSYVTFIRFDLPWRVSAAEDRKGYLESPFRRALVDIQPPDTVIVSLTKSEDEILADMKKKTRYNIRLARKKGVIVRSGSLRDLETWYEIYQETAERDGISIHSYDYYRKVFQEGLKRKNPSVRLLLAEVEGDVVAGNIIALHGTSATYLYGASRSVHRNLMPTYLLQWEAIRIAKQHGCESYDLYGIPPLTIRTIP